MRIIRNMGELLDLDDDEELNNGLLMRRCMLERSGIDKVARLWKARIKSEAPESDNILWRFEDPCFVWGHTRRYK